MDADSIAEARAILENAAAIHRNCGSVWVGIRWVDLERAVELLRGAA